jgi:zinc protease
MKVRRAIALLLPLALGCEESARFGSAGVVRAPHPGWKLSQHASWSTPDERFRVRAPMPRADTDAKLPKIDEAVLGNGVRILTAQRHSLPIVAIRVVVGGTGPGAAGAAPLAAHMMFAGTTHHEGLRVRQELSEMGAQSRSFALYGAVVISAIVPSTNVSPALRMLAEVVREAAFPQDQIEERRAALRADLARDASAPQTAAAEQLDELLYPPGSPYHDPAEGSDAAVRRVTRDDLVAFWRSTAVPSGTTFLVAGDFDRVSLLGILHELLDGWSAAPAPARSLPPAVVGPISPGVVLLDHPGDSQAVVRLGWRGPDRSSDDIVPLWGLASSLGHDASGRIGTLFQELRIDRGDTYGVSASISERPGASEFTIATAVERDHAGEAIRTILDGVDALRRKGIDDPASLQAHGPFDSYRWRAPQTCEDVVDTLTPVAVFGQPLDEFLARLRSSHVSAEGLHSVAARYLGAGSRAVVVVGDAALLRPSLERIGFRDIAVRPLTTSASD